MLGITVDQTETPSEPSPWYRAYDLFDARSRKSARTPAPHQQRALDKLEKWYREPDSRLGGPLLG